jgi:dTDP-4-amino-4,6-dideoxygalactose transaminase
MQAAILRVKLAHLDDWNARRAGIAARYQEGLAATGLQLPFVPDWAEPAWHLYVVQDADRAALQQALAADGIGTLIHYPIPPHLQDAYAELGHKKGAFPIAERIHERVLSLPISPTMTLEQADEVIAACRKARTAC